MKLAAFPTIAPVAPPYGSRTAFAIRNVAPTDVAGMTVEAIADYSDDLARWEGEGGPLERRPGPTTLWGIPVVFASVAGADVLLIDTRSR